ncbi:MAG TPA: hypothetical protein VKW78_00250 [Terriglobales bacterium]|nr:hypothetical protein [Terriglobales bacterium]
MIVTAATFMMMQMIVHQVIGMIAVWNGLVTATFPVDMSLFVTATVVTGSSRCRVLCIDADRAFVNVPLMRVMKMAIMNVVRMAFVLN